MQRRSGRLAAAVVLLAGVLGACGGSGPGPVAPEAWWKSVCGAVKPWSAEIAKLQAEAKQKISDKSDAAATKAQLVMLFDGMEDVTEDALSDVRKAGVPDVPDGRMISDQFVAALTAARDSFGTGRKSVEELSTADNAAFYEGVVAAGDAMSKQNSRAGEAFSQIKSPELDKAYDQVAECR